MVCWDYFMYYNVNRICCLYVLYKSIFLLMDPVFILLSIHLALALKLTLNLAEWTLYRGLWSNHVI